MSVYGPKINEFAQSRLAAKAGKEKERSKDFLGKAKLEKNAQVFPSGLIYTELRAGDGASPAATDSVKAHYKGTLINGKEFDSSYKRGEPTDFELNHVIPCWTEGIQKMKVGGNGQARLPLRHRLRRRRQPVRRHRRRRDLGLRGRAGGDQQGRGGEGAREDAGGEDDAGRQERVRPQSPRRAWRRSMQSSETTSRPARRASALARGVDDAVLKP